MRPDVLAADVSIREMIAADVPAGLLLCRASRWNQTESDWRHLLAAAPHGALVAERNGLVIGTVVMLPYGPFAWISMVLVNPDHRGRGVGTELLVRGLALVPAGVTARLDATPAGEGLYRKLGFAGEYGLARWFLDGGRPAIAGGRDARPLEAADWPAVHALDLEAFGASRAPLLERLAREAPEYAWIVEGDDGVLGYLLGRHGHVREHLGPLVADGPQTARQLLGACLKAQSGRDLFIDVPDAQRVWTDVLTTLGFAVERPFLRMSRGRLTAPGVPGLVYAIAGPEFG